MKTFLFGLLICSTALADGLVNPSLSSSGGSGGTNVANIVAGAGLVGVTNGVVITITTNGAGGGGSYTGGTGVNVSGSTIAVTTDVMRTNINDTATNVAPQYNFQNGMTIPGQNGVTFGGYDFGNDSLGNQGAQFGFNTNHSGGGAGGIESEAYITSPGTFALIMGEDNQNASGMQFGKSILSYEFLDMNQDFVPTGPTNLAYQNFGGYVQGFYGWSKVQFFITPYSDRNNVGYTTFGIRAECPTNNDPLTGVPEPQLTFYTTFGQPSGYNNNRMVSENSHVGMVLKSNGVYVVNAQLNTLTVSNTANITTLNATNVVVNGTLNIAGTTTFLGGAIVDNGLTIGGGFTNLAGSTAEFATTGTATAINITNAHGVGVNFLRSSNVWEVYSNGVLVAWDDTNDNLTGFNFNGNGNGLTNLNASSLASGTVTNQISFSNTVSVNGVVLESNTNALAVVSNNAYLWQMLTNGQMLGFSAWTNNALISSATGFDMGTSSTTQGYGFSVGNSLFSGLVSSGSTVVTLVANGTKYMSLGSVSGFGIGLPVAARFCWDTTADSTTGTTDTGLTRNAAGVIEIDNGTAGVIKGSLLASNVTALGGIIIGNSTNTASFTTVFTNFIDGGLYTNATGRNIFVWTPCTFTPGTGVGGNATYAITVGGVVKSVFSSGTLATSLAMPETNAVSYLVTNGGAFAFTNLSSGTGSSAAILPGGYYEVH